MAQLRLQDVGLLQPPSQPSTSRCSLLQFALQSTAADQAASAYGPKWAVTSITLTAACNIRTSIASIDSEIVKPMKNA